MLFGKLEGGIPQIRARAVFVRMIFGGGEGMETADRGGFGGRQSTTVGAEG